MIIANPLLSLLLPPHAMTKETRDKTFMKSEQVVEKEVIDEEEMVHTADG